MSAYRRTLVPGGTYFFTVNLQVRDGNDLLVRHIELLRQVVAITKAKLPFEIDAWVVLPDHLHAVWTLPTVDSDFSLRWAMIKSLFSRNLPPTEPRSPSRRLRGERGIWQRRFWEHMIRDDADFRAHIDYVHVNPQKHGLVKCVRDWPYSTFHRFATKGMYPIDWAGGDESSVNYTE